MDKPETPSLKKMVLIFLLTHLFLILSAQSDFLAEQEKYQRIRTAINEKQDQVIRNLKNKSLHIADLNIIILAYKAENMLEIHAKNEGDSCYVLVASYRICSSSGQLGPKRKQGDYQVPEGFYHIDRFNPASSYYLSLGINYPNLSDKKISTAKDPGGDIFIHGACVTIGCLPMTDDKIKEIYLYAMHARNNGQDRIPVYIFPFKMSSQNFEKYKIEYRQNPELIDFWNNILLGYNKFMLEKKELNVSTHNNGDYLFE